jgi:hypothetical protein
LKDDDIKSKRPLSDGAPVESLRLLARDLFFGGLCFVACTVLWFFGSTWTFWPLWVLLGMVLAFFLRAATEGHWSRGACLQGALERITGSWGQRRTLLIEGFLKKLFGGRLWSSLASGGSMRGRSTAAASMEADKRVRVTSSRSRREVKAVPKKKVGRPRTKGATARKK